MKEVNTYTTICFAVLFINSITGISQTCNNPLTNIYSDNQKNFACASFINSNIGYNVDNHFPKQIISKTIDGGHSWDSVGNITVSNPANKILFLNDTLGFIAGDSLYATFDGGKSWESKSGGSIGSFESIYFIDKDTGYAGGDNKLFGTTDGGNTWTYIQTNGFFKFDVLFFKDFYNGYAAVNRPALGYVDSFIFRTNDGGHTWKQTTFASSSWLKGLHFVKPNIGFTVGYTFNRSSRTFTGFIYKTIDSGNTWQPVYSGYYLTAIDFYDDQNGFASGYPDIILKTSDGGQSWQKYSDTLNSAFNSITAFAPNKSIAFSSDGRVVEFDCDFNIASVHTISPSNDNYNFVIFPNPSKGAFTIQTNYSAQVRILNGFGNEIKSVMVNDRQSNLDLGIVPSGIYYMEVSSDKGRATQKLIIE
jgi:photosystem II stability/assembly factor-like uncharacterized protein